MNKKNSFILILAKFIASTARMLVLTRYKIIIKGEEVLEQDAPLLILPNHPALIDPVICLGHIYRFTPVTPVMSEKYFDIPVVKTFFRNLGAVRVSDLENGSRDTSVLKVIVRSAIKSFNRKNNIVLYPSGQIAGQGYEKIFNKKSAYHIVCKLPEDVQVIGVRITGLWGSMWSKAKTGKSPNFLLQLVKGFFFVLANLIIFVPKRTVTLEFENLTEQSRSNALDGQKPFNTFLEEFYNKHGEEAPLMLKHFFYL